MDYDATIKRNNAPEPRAIGPGSVLAGRYRIVRELGSGGQASVFLAEDLRLDGKLYALKFVPAVIASSKRLLTDLKRETLTAQKLVHPNIVQVRAFEVDGADSFIVMDYVKGRTLAQILDDNGPLPESDALAILKPVAEALDWAHRKGVVHRDIKPSNIMVDENGEPVILDFGIAREIIDSMTMTTGRTISGTLLYMSPEQLRGEKPAPAQDVYSFAATVYQCLNGLPPFVRGAIDYQIVNVAPAPLPGSISCGKSVLRGLAKTAAERPENCLAVLRCEKRVSPPPPPPPPATGLGKVRVTVRAVGKAEKQSVPRRGEARMPPPPKRAANSRQAERDAIKAFENGDWETGFALARLTSLDNATIQFYLGYAYNLGKGVAQNYAEAAKWYRKAAEQGISGAQFNLGILCETGCGVEKDCAEALRWFRKAADQGNAGAQYQLARLFAGGEGIPQNYAEAAKWFRKAAEQGHVRAQSELGALYEKGRGVAWNPDEALRWYWEAAHRGYLPARKKLGLA